MPKVKIDQTVETRLIIIEKWQEHQDHIVDEILERLAVVEEKAEDPHDYGESPAQNALHNVRHMKSAGYHEPTLPSGEIPLNTQSWKPLSAGSYDHIPDFIPLKQGPRTGTGWPERAMRMGSIEETGVDGLKVESGPWSLIGLRQDFQELHREITKALAQTA